jgi:UDP-GlcNAc:undecaprenyl-phosphate GlcNAc-1-phosphate transferase
MNRMGIPLLLIAFLISFLLTPKTLVMLRDGGLTKSNFEGNIIPVGAGIIFSAVLTLTYFLFSLMGKIGSKAYIYLGFLSLVSLMGLLDDVAGNRNNTGFRGHLSVLLRTGEISTGLWKAVLGGVIALLAAETLSVSINDIILNGLLLALATNFINLLDVQPGRSIKFFLFSSILIILLYPSYSSDVLLFPLLGIVSAYFLYDVQGKAMMGDTGSNFLGMALGFSLISGENTGFRNLVLIMLILLHFISEFFSFSRIIKKNKILNFLDNLGRRG